MFERAKSANLYNMKRINNGSCNKTITENLLYLCMNRYKIEFAVF